jgi:hypothetical protein
VGRGPRGPESFAWQPSWLAEFSVIAKPATDPPAAERVTVTEADVHFDTGDWPTSITIHGVQCEVVTPPPPCERCGRTVPRWSVTGERFCSYCGPRNKSRRTMALADRCRRLAKRRAKPREEVRDGNHGETSVSETGLEQ